MFKSLKQSWHRLKTGEPGRRFQQEYAAHQASRRTTWSRPLMIILGVIIVAVGLVALPAPGPGTLVLALGAALLARESKAVAKTSDWLELRLRHVGRWAGRSWNAAPWWGKVAISLAGVALTALAGFGAFEAFVRR